MYVVTGSNIHGQWFEPNPIFDGFKVLCKKKWHNNDYSIDEIKLIYINWSYNVFQDSENFYLSGSVCGNNNSFSIVPLPPGVLKNKLLLCGNDYSLFLFETDKLIMWVINLENTKIAKRINLNTEVPSTIKRWKGDNAIIKVKSSNFCCICLTEGGLVYNGLLPGPVDVSNCIGKVCDIECGYEHYLLLTDKGQIYSWGNGRRLQLGHGDLNNLDTPKEIEALSGINIIKISAGGWHSLALSESGDLYTWGWNDSGQLGIKEIEQHNDNQSQHHKSRLNSYGFPTLVDLFVEDGAERNDAAKSTNIKDISCGNLHSVIILEDYSVWTTGSNKYGQLGFPTDVIKKVFYFKKAYQGLGDCTINCGPWVTVIEPIHNGIEEVSTKKRN